jgi:hypothetical protein
MMRSFLALILISLSFAPSKSMAAEDEPLITKLIEPVSPSVFHLVDPRDKSSQEEPLGEAVHERTPPLKESSEWRKTLRRSEVAQRSGRF